MHGHFPYHQRTYLGGPISPLPGEVLLAVPFVALGKSAYQNLFWVLAFYAVLKHRVGDARMALAAMQATLGLSPTIMRDLVTGSDVLCNGIYVLLFSLLLLRCAERGGAIMWVAAVLLGIGLSSRLHF